MPSEYTPNYENGPLEPLAVIGMSFRFPGCAESVDAFWDMMISKQSASTVTPPSRFNVDAHYHPGPPRIGTMSYSGGNFLDGDPVDAFDARFFSIGAAEAQAMDPVHRLTLEVAYRALENAGLSLEHISGSKTAVFAGSSSTDYSTMLSKDPSHMAKYTATGTGSNMMANRISWFFNLTGPSASVSAACSSSLVALDMTCQSIWAGEATMGLACGGNIILAPEGGMWLDNLGMLSKDSQCFTLDTRANGFARGEGCGVIVIKPLATAVRDGDTVRAVIRATHSNSNGRTAGLTQPSHEAQRRLILDTYAKAGLDMSATRYFEAHGTGTPLGDPIEFGAIGAAFEPYRTSKEPLYVGSVKSNIGHLEGASGIAGVIKAILTLENGVILPNAEFNDMNPSIDADSLKIAVTKHPIAWPTPGLRRISVQSFGFGGSNSHIILDDAYNSLHLRNLEGSHNTNPSQMSLYQNTDNPTSPFDVSAPFPSRLLVWSTEDKEGIMRMKETWGEYFSSLKHSLHGADASYEYLRNLAYTLGLRRSHLMWRSFGVVTDIESLVDVASGMVGPIRAISNPRLAFVFTGQGSQWFAMGRELIDRYDIFRNSLVDASSYLRSLGCGWDVIDELKKNEAESQCDNARYSQPLCTILQVALVQLLDSFSIRPTAVIGHSSGEIAAAYSIGAISRRSAWRLAYWRGALVANLDQKSSTKGSMLAVGLSSEEAGKYLDAVEVDLGSRRLVVACVNSPLNVTISGDSSHMDYLQTMLNRAGGIFTKRLKVNAAYHSFQMQEIADEYSRKIGALEPGSSIFRGKGPVAMVSTVTGTAVLAESLCSKEYWVRNLVSPVLFSGALATICNLKLESEVNVLLEIGPHSALQSSCKQVLRALGKEDSIEYVSLLSRSSSAVLCLLEAMGRLHCLGYAVDLPRVNNVEITKRTSKGEKAPRCLPSLPEYPFDHSKSYWYESRISKGYRFRKFGWHPLLGVPDPDWNPMEAKWRHTISVLDQPWIEDHKIDGTMVFPAAGMFVMVIHAARQLADPSRRLRGFQFKNTTFHSVFKIPPGTAGIEANLYMRPQSRGAQVHNRQGWYDFHLYTHDDDTNEWQEKCHGSVQLSYYPESGSKFDPSREIQEWQKAQQSLYTNALRACTERADIRTVYDGFEELGYGYGPSFRAITALSHNGRDLAVAEVQTHREEGPTLDHIIHPATLDCIFQVMFMALTSGATKRIQLAVPSHFDSLWVSNGDLSFPEAEFLQVSGTARRTGLRECRASITVMDSTSTQSLIQVEGFTTTDIASGEGWSAHEEDHDTEAENICHTVHWKPDLELMSSAQIQKFCDQSEASELSNTAEPIEFFTDLDFLATTYIKDTLKSLSPETIMKLKTNRRTDMYLKWMNSQMDILNAGNSPFSTNDWKNRLADREFIADTANRVAEANPTGALYTSVGTHLLKLLTGEIDTLDFLFRGELTREHYYYTWESIPAVNKFHSFLDALAHKNPNLNILEVGAGTGATTVQLMKTLAPAHGVDKSVTPRFSHFDFTDLSPFFFGAAEHQFSHLGSRMRYKKLDIEIDPTLQGFEEGSYDLVVAAAVIHTTSDVTKTLENCRKLLKPNGTLVLWEGTVPHGLRSNFVFGLLDGWWLASEPFRQESPCLDENKWDEVLMEAGFTGADVVLRDYSSDICHEFSIIISTSTQEVSPILSVSPREEIFIIHEPSQQILAESLKASFETANISAVVQVSSVNNIPKPSPKETTSLRRLLVFVLELDQPAWSRMTLEVFSTLQSLLVSTTKVLWVQRGDEPGHGIIHGLSRVVNSEINNDTLNFLHLKGRGTVREEQLQLVALLSKRLLLSINDADTEYTEDDDGFLRIPRLLTSSVLSNEVRQRSKETRRIRRKWNHDNVPLRLVVGTPGLINTLHFVDDRSATREALRPTEVEIRVQNIGLNFKDVLVSLGWLNEQTVGCEIAGVVTRLGTYAASNSELRIGDKVASLATDCYRTLVRCDWQSVVKIPDGIELATAAAMPVNFITAWHALHDIARVQSGQTVLVHSAAGGTGQAVLQIAQHFGAEVFATVGSQEKKDLLIERYGIPDDHIFSSRDVSFAPGIRRLTDNKGVDVVVNSLSGEGLIASWECIAPYGHFVEIGKRDIRTHSKLPMGIFERNASFTAIDSSRLCADRPKLVGQALKQILDLVAKEVLNPAYPLQVYEIAKIQDAFRAVQSGKTMGKLVFELGSANIVDVVLPKRASQLMNPNATYVIAGGLGGLGRSTAAWMVRQGARYLILLSRSGANTASARSFVRELEDQGARVKTPACDITIGKDLTSAIAECLSDMPQIKGCIQASMVLHDSPFETMTFDAWEAAITPKVAGTYNLHTSLPRGLDFFIMFSSIAGVCGSRGQANYAAGNTFQDSLAKYRRERGEAATALDLGPFYDAGWMADKKDLQKTYSKLTNGPLNQQDLFALLDYFCNLDHANSDGASLQHQTVVLRVTASQEASYLQKPMFRHLAAAVKHTAHKPSEDASKGTSTTITNGRVDWAQVFSNKTVGTTGASEAVKEALAEKMATVLSIERNELDSEAPVHRYGVDSLVAVELRNWLNKEVRCELAILDFMGNATIATISNTAVSTSIFRKASPLASS